MPRNLFNKIKSDNVYEKRSCIFVSFHLCFERLKERSVRKLSSEVGVENSQRSRLGKIFAAHHQRCQLPIYNIVDVF